jgi:hypothetical protein
VARIAADVFGASVERNPQWFKDLFIDSVENLFCRHDKFKRLHVRRDKSIASFEMDMLDCG